MSGAIHWDPTGRPFAECPACHKFHAINRRQDYLKKPVIRFYCRNKDCNGMSWKASPEEREKLLEYFAKFEGRRRGRPSTRDSVIENPPADPVPDPEPEGDSFWKKLI